MAQESKSFEMGNSTSRSRGEDVVERVHGWVPQPYDLSVDGTTDVGKLHGPAKTFK